MRSSIVAVAAVLLGLTSAQSVGELPPCAQDCVDPFTDGSEIAGCSGIDIACICSSGVFLEKTACCLNENCSPEDQAAAIRFANNICSTADVEVPSEIVCSGVTAGAPQTSAPETSSPTATQTETSSSTETSTETDTETDTETTPAPTADESTTDGTQTETSATSTSSAAANPAYKAGSGIAGGLLAALAFL